MGTNRGCGKGPGPGPGGGARGRRFPGRWVGRGGGGRRGGGVPPALSPTRLRPPPAVSRDHTAPAGAAPARAAPMGCGNSTAGGAGGRGRAAGRAGPGWAGRASPPCWAALRGRQGGGRRWARTRTWHGYSPRLGGCPSEPQKSLPALLQEHLLFPRLLRLLKGDRVMWPAAGTGGFLVPGCRWYHHPRQELPETRRAQAGRWT